MSQPLPTPGQGDIMAALEQRVRERREKGIATYGRSLQALNGRRALVDALEEAIDLAAYLEQELLERAQLEARVEAACEERLAAERSRALAYEERDAERKRADESAAMTRRVQYELCETTEQKLAAEAAAAELRAALEAIADKVCGSHCPSSWPTENGQPHIPECHQIRKALAAHPEVKP